jgi:sarcosine oxidase
VPDDAPGLFPPETGSAMAPRGNAAHVRLARAHGATLRDQAPVERLRPVGGEIEVTAGGTTYRCRRLVIAAGAWSNGALTHLGMHLPLRVTKEQVTYFATPHQAEFQPGRFPVWIWMDDPCFYGFPIFGEAGPKAGQDAGGLEVGPDTRTFEPDQAALKRTVDFLTTYIPGMLGPIIYTRTCLYTLTPDRDFVIDAVPGHPAVTVGIGGGHGYKFASLIGQILSELAIDGRTERDIEPFRMDRAILQLENPPANYMV